MSYHFTNAPEAYDYSYVKTVATLPSCSWRLIEVSDETRFERFQTPRYLSGLNGVVKADTPDAKHLGLPPSAELLSAPERDSWLDEVSADDGPIDGYDY